MRDGATTDGDRGVTPVIGIVIMVAIVVVLAGVLAVGVYDLGQEPADPVQGGVSVAWDKGVQAGDGSVKVTYVTRGNTERVEISYEVQTNPGSNALSVSGSTTLNRPGETMELVEAAGNADDDIEVHVTVVAFTADGEKAVLADETETI